MSETSTESQFPFPLPNGYRLQQPGLIAYPKNTKFDASLKKFIEVRTTTIAFALTCLSSTISFSPSRGDILGHKANYYKFGFDMWDSRDMGVNEREYLDRVSDSARALCYKFGFGFRSFYGTTYHDDS